LLEKVSKLLISFIKKHIRCCKIKISPKFDGMERSEQRRIRGNLEREEDP
jgi:hypothetical protein